MHSYAVHVRKRDDDFGFGSELTIEKTSEVRAPSSPEIRL